MNVTYSLWQDYDGDWILSCYNRCKSYVVMCLLPEKVSMCLSCMLELIVIVWVTCEFFYADSKSERRNDS